VKRIGEFILICFLLSSSAGSGPTLMKPCDNNSTRFRRTRGAQKQLVAGFKSQKKEEEETNGTMWPTPAGQKHVKGAE
jgi:hypothetical protein